MSFSRTSTSTGPKESIDTAVVDSALSMLASTPDIIYTSVGFRGFAGTLDETTLEILQNHPDVDFIEQDTKASLADYVSQSDAGWNLARVSHRKLNATQYVYDESAGEGTCSYVIDSGVFLEHDEFEGRAKFLADFGGDDDGVDYIGHGTHVAGILGGRTFGIAKKTNIFAVKMISKAFEGTASTIIAAADFVANDAQTRDCPKGIVVNMSVGNPRNEALNAAVAALVSDGLFVAVASHNFGTDAYNYSPGSEPTVCTVGASTPEDSVASFSDYGALVNVFAPGVNVESAWISDDGSTNTTSIEQGTSMASPTVAGLAAYLLALEGPRDPIALCERIRELSTKDILSSIPDEESPNMLIFNGNPSG
ncbi:hypothetical protein MGN70_006803 [Eutypa lata]|nr:hypothetical protein MGN70_006803 [Eutypa lata]